ncbi:MAG: glycosyl hydrolase family 2 [Prevotella sp.]|nr:glycosyl hydrolase family 2 [Prevotella sp.]
MKRLLFFFYSICCTCCVALAQQWPTPQQEAKAGSRWWWLGSAVDAKNLQWTMQQYANHGIGALEITPLYGVQGNQTNNIPYLSDQWMAMLREVQKNGKQLGIEVDMATGTGWPFGGPWVPMEESACKAIFVDTTFVGKKVEGLPLSVSPRDAKNSRLNKVMAYHNGQAIDVTSFVVDGKLTWKAPKSTSKKDEWRVIALYVRYGVMKVKRAAPGGEGLVIDHFDRKAVSNYLKHIEQAFERTNTPYPHTFFNDSYEVSEATWTPTLFDEFRKRRGYSLEEHLPELIGADVKVVSDYRETLGDLLLENFTQQWTAWAHSHGAITRNQAHGSPANLIDCYAAVDIPEIEGFGLSDFGIKGLRTDPGKTRKNDSDYSMFKYAPSAAHVCGKPYTSSETFTWLTEHFRTSLSQLKPDLDLMFCAGVNHMFFHGTCYSPQDDTWPGWKFYASMDMSPTNSIWRDAPYFMQYVERCQSFLQWGQPDNDFLVYLPVRDMWKKNSKKLLMQFSIHAMGKLAPEFIKSILAIDRAGFDCDYISDRLLAKVTIKDNQLVTEGGTHYKAVIIPTGTTITPELKKQLDRLSPYIIYGEDPGAMSRFAKPEPMKYTLGLKAIRRTNPTGHHYFIANLTPNDIYAVCNVAGGANNEALWFNPLTGTITKAECTDNGIRINLRSGESMILQTFDKPGMIPADIKTQASPAGSTASIDIQGPWNLSFMEEAPKVNGTFTLDKLQTWETLSKEAATTMGTGVYTTTLKLDKQQAKEHWMIDLGDVRESARVYINDQFIGCAWSVPFTLDCQQALKAGDNTIRIEVTNLPANRISELDRQGVKWRKMEEINVVDIHYKKTTYADWEPVKSGLNSEIKLYIQ